MGELLRDSYMMDVYLFLDQEIHSDEDREIFSSMLFVGATNTVNPDDYFDLLKPIEAGVSQEEEDFMYDYTEYFITRLHKEWNLLPMTRAYYEPFDSTTDLNQGQIEALAIRFGMNDILWELAD